MKFIGLITIVGAFAATISALPVTNTNDSLDVKPMIDATAKSEVKTADTAATDVKSDTEKAFGSVVDSAIESTFIPFYITSPRETDTFSSNDVVTTSWFNGIEGPFIINVIQGPEPLDMQPTDIFLHANGESGSYQWRVPANLPSGLYGFKYIYLNKGSRTESYSEPFKVVRTEKTSAEPVVKNSTTGATSTKETEDDD